MAVLGVIELSDLIKFVCMSSLGSSIFSCNKFTKFFIDQYLHTI